MQVVLTVADAYVLTICSSLVLACAYVACMPTVLIPL